MNIPDSVHSYFQPCNPPPPDGDWEAAIQVGNGAMAQGHLQGAEQAYLRSLDRADALLDFAQHELDNAQLHVVHLYVISCTNLGSLYQHWQRWDAAEAFLLKGHQRAIALLNAATLPVALRWQAMLALRELVMQVLSFYGDWGYPDRAQTFFQQTHSQVQAFLNYLQETQNQSL